VTGDFKQNNVQQSLINHGAYRLGKQMPLATRPPEKAVLREPLPLVTHAKGLSKFPVSLLHRKELFITLDRTHTAKMSTIT
jgi:hypothetical protein